MTNTIGHRGTCGKTMAVWLAMVLAIVAVASPAQAQDIDPNCVTQLVLWELAGATGPLPDCVTQPLSWYDLDGDRHFTTADVSIAAAQQAAQDACPGAPDPECLIQLVLWELGGGVDPLPECVTGPLEYYDLDGDGHFTVADVNLATMMHQGTAPCPEAEAEPAPTR